MLDLSTFDTQKSAIGKKLHITKCSVVVTLKLNSIYYLENLSTMSTMNYKGVKTKPDFFSYLLKKKATSIEKYLNLEKVM
jgi:hypothetical protein